MPTKKNRRTFVADDALIAYIDDWRANIRPVPTFSDAIRLLIARGCAAEFYSGQVVATQIEELKALENLNLTSLETKESLRSALVSALDVLAKADLHLRLTEAAAIVAQDSETTRQGADGLPPLPDSRPKSVDRA